jgi:hypothetical protein
VYLCTIVVPQGMMMLIFKEGKTQTSRLENNPLVNHSSISQKKIYILNNVLSFCEA